MYLTKIIMGDFVFTCAGLAACAIALTLSLAAPWPRWARIAYGVALAVGLAILLHWGVEAVQAWWQAPLGERMQINME